MGMMTPSRIANAVREFPSWRFHDAATDARAVDRDGFVLEALVQSRRVGTIIPTGAGPA